MRASNTTITIRAMFCTAANEKNVRKTESHQNATEIGTNAVARSFWAVGDSIR
jgi:hypothetical protein